MDKLLRKLLAVFFLKQTMVLNVTLKGLLFDIIIKEQTFEIIWR